MLRCLLEFNNSVSSDSGALEEVVSPLSEGLENSGVLLLDGSSLSGECIWGILGDGSAKWGLLIGREKSI